MDCFESIILFEACVCCDGWMRMTNLPRQCFALEGFSRQCCGCLYRCMVSGKVLHWSTFPTHVDSWLWFTCRRWVSRPSTQWRLCWRLPGGWPVLRASGPPIRVSWSRACSTSLIRSWAGRSRAQRRRRWRSAREPQLQRQPTSRSLTAWSSSWLTVHEYARNKKALQRWRALSSPNANRSRLRKPYRTSLSCLPRHPVRGIPDFLCRPALRSRRAERCSRWTGKADICRSFRTFSGPLRGTRLCLSRAIYGIYSILHYHICLPWAEYCSWHQRSRETFPSPPNTAPSG